MRNLNDNNFYVSDNVCLNMILRKLNNNFYVSDKCRELPDIWSIKADTPLPVNHGTKVELECIPGYSLSGSSVITCVKDRDWEYEMTPKCTLRKL